jgi:serine/threonine-protein kinase mTOR
MQKFMHITIFRYYRMCEAAQLGLGKNASVPSIHGSLLAVGELLR